MSNIESVDGIKYLAYLEEVNLTQNAVSQANFSGLQCLRSVNLSWNPIDTLNLNDCPALEDLSLADSNGSLKTLEFSENPKMRSLDIRNSGITRLNLRTAPLLRQTALYGKITDESGEPKVPGTPSYYNRY